ncbi:glycosyltransferase family 25 protein [Phaeovulum sp.]|uniref:glycosyltransferase family 25 protein n=1 Tax=Phaeovulum sp. TaxID=2934796 RepID=UPI0039E5343E
METTNKLSTYLINLDRATERLQATHKEISTAKLSYERISAFDGRILTDDQRSRYDEALAFKTSSRSLADSEIGCYLSHVRAVELFLKTNSEYCLVLEDDIKLHPDFTVTLMDLMGFLDQHKSNNYDIVNLCNEPKRHYNKIREIRSSNSSFILCRAHFFPVLTTGILWSRDGAKKFISSCYPIHSPIDQFLKDWCIKNDNGLCFLNPPIASRNVESQIDFSSHRTGAKRKNYAINYFITKQIRSFRNKRLAQKSYIRFQKLLK